MTTTHFDNCKHNPNRKIVYKPILTCEWCGTKTDNKIVFSRFHSTKCRKNPNFVNTEKPHKKHTISIEHTCPHCNKTGKGTSMFRFHFDNCKYRKN